MKSSLPGRPLLLSLFSSLLLLLVIHSSHAIARKHPSSEKTASETFSYHNGPLLTGNVNLALMWYGHFGEHSDMKNTTLSFIKSLNNERDVSFEPSVASWWHKVESYQLVAKKKDSKTTKSAPAIQVKVVKQVDDPKASLGKELSSKEYLQLVKKVAAGSPPKTVAVIFTAHNVTVEDVCAGPCYVHGVHDEQLYIVLNLMPGKHCPSLRCMSPFGFAYETALTRFPLRSIHYDADTDAMITHFAAALAATVTNPYSTGFFGGPAGRLGGVKLDPGVPATKPGEAGTACFGVFGTRSFPGYEGRTRIDPQTTGEFNAHGINKEKFLLPALWDPVNSTCWTTL